MPPFPLVLHRTYYTQGFFNLRKAYDNLVRSDEGAVTLLLGENGEQVQGEVNRSANTNGTARIRAPGLNHWFKANAAPGDTIQVEVLDPLTLRLTSLLTALPLPFQPGQLTTHGELAALYGGQQYSGISTPKDAPFIFLFTGEEGGAYGYHDGWDGQEFLYSGEGQIGDMAWKGGNSAIRDHQSNRKRLLLFKRDQPNQMPQRFVGEFQYAGHFNRVAKDREGQPRQTLVFRLLPIDANFTPDADLLGELTELDQLALESALPSPLSVPEGTLKPSRQLRLTSTYVRNQNVVAFILAQAKGICEDCGQCAPFLTLEGTPFLEVHHVIPLGEGGSDTVDNAVAVCPNCHRAAHLSADALKNRQNLLLTALRHKLM